MARFRLPGRSELNVVPLFLEYTEGWLQQRHPARDLNSCFLNAIKASILTEQNINIANLQGFSKEWHSSKKSEVRGSVTKFLTLYSGVKR